MKARLYEVTLTMLRNKGDVIMHKVYHVAATNRQAAIKAAKERQWAAEYQWIHAECSCISGGATNVSVDRFQLQSAA